MLGSGIASAEVEADIAGSSDGLHGMAAGGMMAECPLIWLWTGSRRRSEYHATLDAKIMTMEMISGVLSKLSTPSASVGEVSEKVASPSANGIGGPISCC